MCCAKNYATSTKPVGACFSLQVRECKGACIGQEAPQEYNRRVSAAMSYLRFERGSFLVVGDGRAKGEKSVVLVEEGRYIGYGFFDAAEHPSAAALMPEALKMHVNPMADNKDTQGIIRAYLRTPHKDEVVVF